MALLSALDVAADLERRGVSVSYRTVLRWAKRGRVPHVVLPSGQIRFRPEDLDALLTFVEPASEAEPQDAA